MEPSAPTTTTGVFTLAVILFGHVAGEYAAIAFCALAGSLWALSKIGDITRLQGFLLIVRLVMTAVVLTTPLAWWLEAQYEWPTNKMVAPLAFAIGALGDRWPDLLSEAWSRLRTKLFGSADK